MRKQNRKLVRIQQKVNKRKGKDSKVVICSQNFNGNLNEMQMEEVHLQMTKLNIDIVCGQEGRRPSTALTRWDTEELLITFEEEGSASRMKKDGNFFILSAKMKEAFLRGGK